MDWSKDAESASADALRWSPATGEVSGGGGRRWAASGQARAAGRKEVTIGSGVERAVRGERRGMGGRFSGFLGRLSWPNMTLRTTQTQMLRVSQRIL